MIGDSKQKRGSVTLVAFCFVAVLGIALASYLAVASQAMKLSNRSLQAGVGQQLAELGLEEGLRAFNKNDWSNWSSGGTSVNWTLDTTNRRARCSITFPTGKFGQGVTATVKIRVDNYDSATVAGAWSSTANYQVNNLVGYTDGNWYRCISPQSGKTPSTSSTAYWVQEQSPLSTAMSWQSGTAYIAGNMVNQGGNWYRCTSANTSSSSNKPPNVSYWVSVPYLSADSDLHYVNESILNYYGTWYRYFNGWQSPPPITWNYNSGSSTYTKGSNVYYNNVWYTYTSSTPSSTIPPTNTTYWATTQSQATTAATGWAWNTAKAYNLNDVVYSGSYWYRCIVANSGQTPASNSTFWSVSPLLSCAWDSTRQYSANDTVFYKGAWYLCLQTSGPPNPHVPPTTATSDSYWSSTSDSTRQWSSTTGYSAGTYQSYGGVWYKCLSSITGQSPNNTTYWTPSWTNSSGATTGGPVIYAESTVAIINSPSIKTQIRAAISPAPLFPNAAGATGTLTFDASATGTVSSYDSVSDPNAAITGYSAILAGGSSVTVNNSLTVNGYVTAPPATTSPYAPLFTYTGNTAVKGTAAIPSPKIDATRVTRSPIIPNFSIHSVPHYNTLADASTWTGSGKTIGTVGATTPTYYYYSGSMSLNSSSQTLTIVGPVILDIQSQLHIQTLPACQIVIADTGSAEIHVGGQLLIDSDGGGIDNQTHDPKKCVILSTSSSSSNNFSSTQAFYGVIYMPSGSLTIDANPSTIYGAVSAQNITFSNATTFKYDISLRSTAIPGIDQPYSTTEWRQLTDPSELATMP